MTLTQKVAEQITTLGSQAVEDRVVEILVEEEMGKRTQVVINAVNSINKQKKELNKINRNDVITYVDGKEVTAMSKQRYDEIKKAVEKLEKTENLLAKALESNNTDDYGKLEQHVNNIGQDKSQG